MILQPHATIQAPAAEDELFGVHVPVGSVAVMTYGERSATATNLPIPSEPIPYVIEFIGGGEPVGVHIPVGSVAVMTHGEP